MNSPVDILNLEWPQSDRDRHIVTPVYLYLQKKYSLNIKVENIFQGFAAIKKYKPRLLLISNFGGAGVNHQIVKYAFLAGIKVVSLISEGNVKEEAADQYLWGWNKEKKLYVDRLLVWTDRSKEIFSKFYPKISEKIVVTGGTGFDRYKILSFISKKEFLKSHGLEKYNRVIGIAAWGFDHFFGDYYERHKIFYLEKFGIKQIEMHRTDLYLLQKIYAEMIIQNPNTLFVLRHHPGTLDYDKNEFKGLEGLPNVFRSSRKENWQYKISDLISVSDLWIGYESTTALEAWLMKKATFLINPSRHDFVRENVYKGSPIAKNAAEAQEMIDKYFISGSLPGFEKREGEREKIIKDVIGFDDGRNYIRAAEEINKILNEPEKTIELKKIPENKIWRQKIRYFLMNLSGHPQFRDVQKEVESYEALYREHIAI